MLPLVSYFSRTRIMKLFLLLCIDVLSIDATSDADLWVEFKQNHSKTYKNVLEDKLRFSIFQDNLRAIEIQNAKYEKGEETYFLKVTQFADLTDEEFESTYLRYQPSKIEYDNTFVLPDGEIVPDAIDWRKKGAVLEIKDQGRCSSCWAFSVTGALEGQNAIKHGIQLSLSDEELVECSTENRGCRGGRLPSSFTYVMQHGISTETSYPYRSSDGVVGKCSNGTNSGIKVTGYTEVLPSEKYLKEAVGTVGPISIGMNGIGIKLYSGGIFNYPSCEKMLNHAALAVGYDTIEDLDYWIVKNSWGPNWGEHGFFRIARNRNQQCGISFENVFPNLA